MWLHRVSIVLHLALLVVTGLGVIRVAVTDCKLRRFDCIGLPVALGLIAAVVVTVGWLAHLGR